MDDNGDNRYHKKDNDGLKGGVGAGDSKDSGEANGNMNLLAGVIISFETNVVLITYVSKDGGGAESLAMLLLFCFLFFLLFCFFSFCFLVC